MSGKLTYKAQRVAIFIDVQNLYHSAKNLFNSRVNFKNIVKEGVRNRQLIRAFAYVVKTEDSPGELAFFEALEKIGIDLRIKDIQIFPGGIKKADWDVGMAVDAIRLSPSVDVIILATGDGDFLPLVEYLQGHGKQVEIMAFGKSASSKLKERSDEFIDLSLSPEKFLLKA
jgi:uncharacterized LabA/DUF88 family protein